MIGTSVFLLSVFVCNIAIRYSNFIDILIRYLLAEKFGKTDLETLATVKSSDIQEVASNSLSPKANAGFSSGPQFHYFFWVS